MTKRAPFKEADVTRLIRATEHAGWDDAVVEVIYDSATGTVAKLTIARRTGGKTTHASVSENEWLQ